MTSASPLSPLDPFQAACENATVALFVIDGERRCIYMNAVAEALTGYARDAIYGRTLHAALHPLQPDGRPYATEDCPLSTAALRGDTTHGEDVFAHRDGHVYPVAFTVSPVRHAGLLVGTAVEVRDLTHEREREHEDVGQRQLAELMLHELDLTRMVQAVTDTATTLTGAQFGAFFYNVTDGDGDRYMLYALSGVPAEHFAKFPHPRATPLFAPTFQGEGTICMDDVFADARYGHWAPHHGMPPGHLPVRSYLAVPVKSDTGEVLGGLFFGHERVGVFGTRHVRTVESIAALAAVGMSRLRLFEAAATQTRETERLYQESLRANRMKDQFLATVSHELRTPLTSILGWSEMLASDRLTPDAAQRAIATIDRNARAQAQIVEDLLDISRIVSGKLQLDVRDIDVATPVEAAVDAVRAAAVARDVRLNVDIAPDTGRLTADPDRLQQIVWNLVANAVKFTDRGGAVDVCLHRDADSVEIHVRDSGRGIEAAFLPRVFDRFSQVDASSTREHGGLGLGLSIVRHLVELHGGSVRVHSDGVGHGAEFTVRLPFSTAHDVTRDRRDRDVDRVTVPPAPPGADTLDGCRVLLVEDDDDARELLASVLEAHGAFVTACASAFDALEAAAARPDVIVSDIGMPRMDGYAFIQSLRAWEQAHARDAAPAVALTAYARAEDRTRALAHGFQMHVAKPVQPAELVTIVQALRGWRAPASSGHAVP